MSESLEAKPHGRVDMVLCALKVLLALVVSLRATVSTAVIVIVLCVAAAVQLYALLFYLPYFKEFMNHLTCSFGMVFAWATVCSLMAYVRDQPDDQVEAFVLIFSLPAVAFSGLTIARQRLYAMRQGGILARNSQSMTTTTTTAASGGSAATVGVGAPVTNACMVELRTRQMLSGVDLSPASLHSLAVQVSPLHTHRMGD
jgi:hypothetical protein